MTSACFSGSVNGFADWWCPGPGSAVAHIWTVAVAAGTGRVRCRGRLGGHDVDVARRRTDCKGGLCNDAEHASHPHGDPRAVGGTPPTSTLPAIFHREIPNARAERNRKNRRPTVNGKRNDGRADRYVLAVTVAAAHFVGYSMATSVPPGDIRPLEAGCLSLDSTRTA